MSDDPKPHPDGTLVPSPTSAAARHQSLIVRVDSRLERRSRQIMEHAMAAMDLDDEGKPVDPALKLDAQGKPEGWSWRKYQVARDSRRPMKTEPGYLARAGRVFDAFQRAKASQPPAPQLNVAAIHVHITNPAAQAVVPRYRVIDAIDEERK